MSAAFLTLAAVILAGLAVGAFLTGLVSVLAAFIGRTLADYTRMNVLVGGFAILALSALLFAAAGVMWP